MRELLAGMAQPGKALDCYQLGIGAGKHPVLARDRGFKSPSPRFITTAQSIEILRGRADAEPLNSRSLQCYSSLHSSQCFSGRDRAANLAIFARVGYAYIALWYLRPLAFPNTSQQTSERLRRGGQAIAVGQKEFDGWRSDGHGDHHRCRRRDSTHWVGFCSDDSRGTRHRRQVNACDYSGGHRVDT